MNNKHIFNDKKTALAEAVFENHRALFVAEPYSLPSWRIFSVPLRSARGSWLMPVAGLCWHHHVKVRDWLNKILSDQANLRISRSCAWSWHRCTFNRQRKVRVCLGLLCRLPANVMNASSGKRPMNDLDTSWTSSRVSHWFQNFSRARAKQQLSVFPRLAMAMQRPPLRKQLSKHYTSIRLRPMVTCASHLKRRTTVTQR